MTITDILILVAMLLSMVLGFRDGFFKKLFGIIGFYFGLVCATKLMNPFGGFIIGWLDFSKNTSYVLAFFIVFLFIVVIQNLVYRWFGSSGTGTLKIRTRLFGSLLGAVQGAVAISLVIIALDIFGTPSEQEKEESLFYGEFLKVAPLVFDYTTAWVPESKAFLDEVKETFQRISSPK